MASASTGEEGGALTLNIIPMLDVFSILIVFLLMSFSTDPVMYEPNAGVELPTSKTLVSLDEIPTVVVAETEILVNGNHVADVVNGDVPTAQKSQGAVYPVYKELVKLAEANKRLRKSRAQLDPASKAKTDVITMEMDGKHRFMLMRRVMLAAQQAEFITFKLMVSKDVE